jgi:hypothetical protein
MAWLKTGRLSNRLCASGGGPSGRPGACSAESYDAPAPKITISNPAPRSRGGLRRGCGHLPAQRAEVMQRVVESHFAVQAARDLDFATPSS